MENQTQPVTDLAVAPSAERPKHFRIVSTMFLDWPQHGFALHAQESGIRNDFESPSDVPEGVRSKLTGFIRSGHVRFYDLSTTPPTEVTPKVEPLDDEGRAPETEQDPFAAGKEPPLQGRPSPGAPVPQTLGSDVTNSGTPTSDEPKPAA